jgi:hypothetical protein
MIQIPKLFKRKQPINCKKAMSGVISTIILSGILLTILVVASFVSLNILGAQMTSTEFDQAKSNMLLLDSTIQDVSLRPGAGGYVQFNEREGGIGISTTTDSLTVTATDGQTTQSTPTYTSLVQLVYSGGTSASAAVTSAAGYTSLRGDPATTYVTLTQGLGALRLQQDDGAKIKLDYNRVRIVSTGLIDSQGTNLVQITFIHLLKGEINGASGSVNIMVQNSNTNPTTWTFENAAVDVTIHQNANTQTYTVTPPVGALRTIVVFSEISVTVSIK